ncbi:hypothetical protein HELRODRAFT_178656 [Helobdella robusta]|uniref:DUF3719 domain-containing protein n=1 Tax=Helobdella robusta TaxID=6412 RepID=T1FDI5_HELRO|nr:hypothetical protein HELRODRAFT_178656 [Helobdella robusta]ESN96856.1 hypothetical protein HELRODRAFT_178656 [Helobdella robusta]
MKCYKLEIEKDYEKNSTKEIKKLFEELEELLYSDQTSKFQENKNNLYVECRDWLELFPHFRITGHSLGATNELGYSVHSSRDVPDESVLQFEINDENHLTDARDYDFFNISTNDKLRYNSLTIFGSKITLNPPLLSNLNENSGWSAVDGINRGIKYDGKLLALGVDEILYAEGNYEEVIVLDYKDRKRDSKKSLLLLLSAAVFSSSLSGSSPPTTLSHEMIAYDVLSELWNNVARTCSIISHVTLKIINTGM